jgi:ribosomal protein S18 acetylase RimI-like enzyme
MNIYYRSATIEDAAALANIEIKSMQSAYREFMPAAHLEKMDVIDLTQRWKGFLQSAPDDRVVVAVHEETVIGFVRAGKTREETVGFIFDLFLLPEYWGAGIGKALMGKAMEIFRDFNFTSAKLYAYCDNVRAIRFYEGLGWALNGQTYTQHIEGIKLEMVCYQRAVEG